MGEGYGCSNFQCSTLATAIHSCRQAAIVSKVAFFTSDRSLFVHQIKDDTPIFNDRSQRRKGHNSWVTMHALHVK